MSDTGLVIENLSLAFGAAKVLSDVNLSVARGELVGLVGPNGAGKTTTLNAISAVVRPQGGRITIDGRAYPARPDAMAAAGVVHVPEGRGLFGDLTVLQNLRVGALSVGRRLEGDDLDDALSLFPKLSTFLHTKAGLLSGGEQQMVAIARGIVARPKVLMVDEMSLGLAPAVIAHVLGALVERARRDNLGLLIVDQNVRLLTRACDSISVLHAGRAVEAGHDEDAIQASYFGAAR
jgi:branched-chain amino acid transport system ATP-binding protein